MTNDSDVLYKYYVNNITDCSQPLTLTWVLTDYAQLGMHVHKCSHLA